MKADVYFDGKLILVVVGYQNETNIELRERVMRKLLVVVPPAPAPPETE